MEILSFILLLVIGGLAGWAATKLFKNDKQHGVVAYIAIGVVGAVIGKYLLGFLGFKAIGEGVIVDFIFAFVGAVVLVGVSKFIAGKLIK